MEKKSNFIMSSFYGVMMTIILSALILSGCNDDNDDRGRIEILTVSSKLVPTGTNPSTNDIVYVMEATGSNPKEKYYLALGRIEGFDYVEGYLYKLKVKITPIKNPPMDGHTETFQLIEILSKEKAE